MRTRIFNAALAALVLVPFAHADGLPVSDAGASAIAGGDNGGVRYPKDKEEEFVAELRDVYYRYYGASLSEIDPIQLIREAFALIYRMHLQLPTRFVLLDRAIATLGSGGMELYPDFNVFDLAKPYARELMI
jgi:predicted unusual protein kinase regulating ubiquinone biosynthesis (AarF/ABC1/UbiB family)